MESLISCRAYHSNVRIGIIADACVKHDITLLYHNHDFEFVKINGQYALDLLYKEIPSLQTEIDTCWVNVAGENPVTYIRKYSGRAPIVHLKDFVLAGYKSEHMYELIGKDSNINKDTGSFEFRPLGAGQQDVPSLIKAAEAAGTCWIVVEQDNLSMSKSAMDCARTSMEYLELLKF